MHAWEAVGVIPLNARRVLLPVARTQKTSPGKAHSSKPHPPSPLRIPKTPRAVSRATRSALPLVQRDTPISQQLKGLLTSLSEGYQETMADKVLGEEAHHQYRDLVGGQKKKKTADRRKLTQATVVTSAMIIDLREKRERIDAEKASRQARKDGKAATQAVTTSVTKKNPTKLKKKNVALAASSSLPSIEEGVVTGSDKEDGREMDEWEDNESDGSEFKGSLGRVCEGMERIQVSGGMGDGIPEPGSPGFHVDNSLRRSGRLSEARK